VDSSLAEDVVEYWSRGSGVVARGPKSLMSIVPATPGDVERHCGRRPDISTDVWRLEVSGRFIASQGVLYPSGVPFPEELHDQTAIVSGEVWLYADGDGEVLGAYWWPDAVRRPIASVPRDEYDSDEVIHPLDAPRSVDVPVPTIEHTDRVPVVAVRRSRRDITVFCTKGHVPEPLNEMCIYEQGGISLSARVTDRPDHVAFLRRHQPPYRRLSVRGCTAIAREPGRSLGPQTWPWPGELMWWDEGVRYEVKGFEGVSTLVEIATSMTFLPTGRGADPTP
jgi:hypothetical protein